MKTWVVLFLYLLSLSAQGNTPPDSKKQDCLELLLDNQLTLERLEKHKPEKISYYESPFKILWRKLFPETENKSVIEKISPKKTPLENEVNTSDKFYNYQSRNHWSLKSAKIEFKFSEWKPKARSHTLDKTAQNQIVNEMSDLALHYAVSDFSSSHRINEQLDLYAKSQSNDFFKDNKHYEENSAEALYFQSKLSMRKIDYESLEEFFALLNRDINVKSNEAISKINTLSEILNLFQKKSGISDEAKALIDEINKIVPRSKAGNENIGRVVLGHLPGPLSRQYINEKYSNDDKFDWDLLIKNLKSGKLAEIIVALKSNAISALFLHSREDTAPTKKSFVPGRTVPINDGEFHFDVTYDFDDYEYFHREGHPPSMDIIRVLSGDMLKRTYHDTIDDPRTYKLVPLVDTAFLVDHSGSMEEHSKEIYRNAMVAAYLERAAEEIMEERANHIIRYIPFGDNVLKDEIIIARTLPEIFDLYKKLIEKKVPPSKQATNITAAWLTAIDAMLAELSLGTNTSHANIVTITDGIDHKLNPTAITEKLSQIPSHIEIGRNVINFDEKNEKLKAMVSAQSTGSGNDSYSTYQYFSVKTLQSFAKEAKFVHQAQEIAEETAAPPEAVHHIGPQKLDELRRTVLELMGNRQTEIEEGIKVYNKLDLLLFDLDKGEEDYDLDQFVKRFHTYKNSVLYQTLLPAEKALFINDFLRLIAFRYDISVDALVKKMSLNTRSLVREMLTDKGLI